MLHKIVTLSDISTLFIPYIYKSNTYLSKWKKKKKKNRVSSFEFNHEFLDILLCTYFKYYYLGFCYTHSCGKKVVPSVHSFFHTICFFVPPLPRLGNGPQSDVSKIKLPEYTTERTPQADLFP